MAMPAEDDVSSVPFRRLFIANRGEIAVRIARAAQDLGLTAIACYAPDDATSLHVKAADEAVALTGSGARAYLDGDGVIAAAKAAGADAIHPGYGFLSENAGFAEAIAAAGLCFVGPSPSVLSTFGDKAKARALAAEAGVPLLPGTATDTTLDEATSFFHSDGHGAIMIKAIAGGGGRGMRLVTNADDLEDAYRRCRAEAEAAFGSGAVYVERFLPAARHIEVQVVGDHHGQVTHLWERDCSVQRRHQKLIEVAPAPYLPETARAKILDAATRLAARAGIDSLSTVEFLANADDPSEFFFMETNPRLQVEHTVTEEVTGIDLVQTQIRIAAGTSLADLGLTTTPSAPKGFAIELRVNAERLLPDGTAVPADGRLSAFEAPSGPGIRIDAAAYQGYEPNPNYDSLIAKLIVREPSNDFTKAAARAYRALTGFRIEGCDTNRALHLNILKDPAFQHATTRYFDEYRETLTADASHPERYFAGETTAQATHAVAAIDVPDDLEAARAPLRATIVSIEAAAGDVVAAGQELVILEAMKMQHVVTAPCSGTVRELTAGVGETVVDAHPLVLIEPSEGGSQEHAEEEEFDLDRIRPDLAEVLERIGTGLDENRPDAVARRRKTNQRTVRENVDDLCDPDSFIEYGALVLAAQRRRRSMDDLIKMSPGDGMVCGLGQVNGLYFPEDKARTAVLAYDYTVFAGTQGGMNHKKTDRVLEIAEEAQLPIVFFTEGGGGRPGDTDGTGVAGLDVPTFHTFAKLSGLAPRIAINSGRCFAGNAALFGCSDITIATANSTIGMGGPAMIEGGGLGTFTPEEVGPMEMQTKNGVVDIAVKDEGEAVATAKQVLGYFQGRLDDWEACDQRLLRRLIPENRLRVYDIRPVIEAIADTGSFIELKRDNAIGMLTGFVRIEGRPMGLIANNPKHLGGAIDAEGAEKAAHFLQLCGAFDLPVLSLCDTPGFMVGPESEAEAAVRRVSRMFTVAATLDVPLFTVVLRKGYGLGAQAMAAGSFARNAFIISWPTGEFGGMGLEGAVKLGYRKELEAETDPQKQKELYDSLVARMYERGKAISMASVLEIDAVIDPVDTRRCILQGLKSWPTPPARIGKKRPFVDTW